MKISHINTNLFKYFSAKTLHVKHNPDAYNSYKNKPIWKYIHLPKNFFRLNIFAVYFRLDSSLSPSICLFLVWSFSLYQKKKDLLSSKELLIISTINVPLNIDWLANFSSHKILIGSFEFNRKPVEILLTAFC